MINQTATATTVVWLFALIGVVPGLMHIVNFLSEGLLEVSSVKPLYAFLLHEYSVITFLLMFIAGCAFAVYAGKRSLILPLLPLLMLVIWPIFAAKEIALPVPAGAVVAFDSESECPRGWSEYKPLAGRMILGAGLGNKDENGKLLLKRMVTEMGGVESQILTKEQMPSHNHNNGLYKFLTKSDNNYTTDKHYDRKGSNEPNLREIAEIKPSGENQPHNNMPPYYVMQYCKKD